jgi:cytoskeletal protein RodZ
MKAAPMQLPSDVAASGPASSGPVSRVRPISADVAISLGSFLRHHRDRCGIGLVEVSRVTRIPASSLDAIEHDRFDELPGEVFVRGFLKAYAQAVRLDPADVLARYTSSRRGVHVTPLPVPTALQVVHDGQGQRFGVAIAFVLLLILLSLALSIVLKPRGRDMPAELSERLPTHSQAVGPSVASSQRTGTVMFAG